MRLLAGLAIAVLAFVPERPSWWQLTLGLVGMPALSIAWQAMRTRWNPQPQQALGHGAMCLTLIAVAVLLSFAVTRPSTMLYLAISLLAAAVRGYSGCEVLAIGNWLLRRDDQLGCIILSPVDAAEQNLEHRRGARG